MLGPNWGSVMDLSSSPSGEEQRGIWAPWPRAASSLAEPWHYCTWFPPLSTSGFSLVPDTRDNLNFDNLTRICSPSPQHQAGSPTSCWPWAANGEGQRGNADRGLSVGIWALPTKPYCWQRPYHTPHVPSGGATTNCRHFGSPCHDLVVQSSSCRHREQTQVGPRSPGTRGNVVTGFVPCFLLCR